MVMEIDVSHLYHVYICLPYLKLTYHLEIDGWKTILSFWGPAYFQGVMLVFGGCIYIYIWDL